MYNIGGIDGASPVRPCSPAAFGEANRNRRPCQLAHHSIWVGVTEATQLGVALENAKFARPMTHDLMLDALTNLDTRVDHVLISDVRGSMFFARLVLRHHDRLIELDARPSDAISLALRQNAPLYVEDSVLDRASYPFVYRKRADRTTEFEEFKSFVQTLEPEDFEQ